MNQILVIAAGGALGALFRFWVSGMTYAAFGRDFPYGTLMVNVTGSLLIGLFYVLLIEKLPDTHLLRMFVLIGVLGAFTTFSTFTMETFTLFEQGAYIKVVANIFASVSLCLIATWFGVVVGRQL
ncbi:MAG: fluoride efflux transporter CrcB [Gammaproteobacteria bacterium]|nr:fluoride efflux transporter CrcB [Gammaproteobacteria bacterium]MDH5594897.1 fluoride efflux transporter CrcB [Gammaproteobacteria bacterium]